ncbi:MAG: leucine-rich repeat protein [Kiritimatiellia bacterium]
MKLILALLSSAIWIEFGLAVVLTDIVNGVTYTYTVEDGQATIGDGYSAAVSSSVTGTLNIPAVLGGYPVSRIGDFAFISRKFTSVVIPQGVVTIGCEAFRGCANLTTVVIPDSVREIEWWAFKECKKLANLKIPEGVEVIEDEAFTECDSLTKVVLPDSLTEIGHGAFGSCRNLTEVEVPDLPERCVSSPFYYYGNKLKRVVVRGTRPFDRGLWGIGDEVDVIYAQGESTATVSGVTYTCIHSILSGEAQIGNGNDPAISQDVAGSLQIPNRLGSFAVTRISEGAFIECTNLTSVTIPNGVRSIGTCAFAGCRELMTVVLPNSLERLDESAFHSCSKLTSVEMPVSVTSVGCWAFEGCENLVTVVMPDGITTVGGQVFSDCKKLQRVVVLGSRPIDKAAWGLGEDVEIVYTSSPKSQVSVRVIGNGTVTGGGVYAMGKTVTLKAMPGKGYLFSGWELEGAEWPVGFDERTPTLNFKTGALDSTATAHFIPAKEDFAEIEVLSGAFRDEYDTGVGIEPITLTVESGSLPKLSVRGLPSGLKFTAKPTKDGHPANTIYGTPTRSGVYTIVATATTVGKASAARSWTVVVRKPGERLVKIAFDSSQGKVTGAGIYPPGKKVALKAAALKGYAFAGWQVDGETLVSERNPSWQLTMGDRDILVHARFVPVAEDATLRLFIGDVEIGPSGTDTFSDTGAGFDLAVESHSLPKVAVSGLPPGLRFDSKLWRITGFGTKPGLYLVKVKVTNASVKKPTERTFRIEVPNLTGANDYFVQTLRNAPGQRYVSYAGTVNFVAPDLTLRTAANLRVSGLPSGLKYNIRSGQIEGVPTNPGIYTVTLTVGRDTSTCTMEILPLPTWLVGTFNGYDRSVDGNLPHGTYLLMLSSSGTITEQFQGQDGYRENRTARGALKLVDADGEGFPMFQIWEPNLDADGYDHRIFRRTVLSDGITEQGVCEGAFHDGGSETYNCLRQNLWGKGQAFYELGTKLKGIRFHLLSDTGMAANLTVGVNGTVSGLCTLGNKMQNVSGVLVVEDSDRFSLNLSIPALYKSFLQAEVRLHTDGAWTLEQISCTSEHWEE